MRIDAYNHFFPKKYFEKMIDVAGGHKDIGKRVRGIPAIHDLDERFRSMDPFDNYKQIISIALPPPEEYAKPEQTEELCQIANDGMAELCQKYPDRFAGIPSGSPCGPDGISAFARYLPDVQSNRLIDNKTARAVVRQAGGRNAYRRL